MSSTSDNKKPDGLSVERQRGWVRAVQQGIDALDASVQEGVMKQAGENCAAQLLALCGQHLGRPVGTPWDLIQGWNKLRDVRGLNGRWQVQGDTITAEFGECGCYLVRLGLIEPSPSLCHCSQSMMDAVFSRSAGADRKVKILKSVGRGDDVCRFEVEV
ncbi:MAG: hypothetical protein PVG03_19025 [Desulfarculaceae bacterium]|jgi:hypothetical protein